MDEKINRDVESEFLKCVGKIVELYAKKADTMEAYNTRMQGIAIAIGSVSIMLGDESKPESDRIATANESIDLILESMGDLLDRDKIDLTNLRVSESCTKTTKDE